MSAAVSSAGKLFSLPELLELILLSLPVDTPHEEVASIRFIYLSRTTSRTWHNLLSTSAPIRNFLYLPTVASSLDSKAYLEKSFYPPARPNPWIPHLLLRQRSWGTAHPFENSSYGYSMCPARERYWTFSFELSNAQYLRLEPRGPWRDMLASSPPFTDFWITRCVYELGSGRTFVTHLDYNPKRSKHEQRYRFHCKDGVTLGAIVDAVSELFEKHHDTKFVMVENLRVPAHDDDQEAVDLRQLEDDRQTTKASLLGSSADRGYGWHRAQ